MAMRLDQIVPFGRMALEYEAMFDLQAAEAPRRILGVGDGPASFNAEWSAAPGFQGRIVSMDPVYAYDGAAIRARFEAVVDGIMAQVAGSPDDWVWRLHRDVAHLRQMRTAALERFLADYDAGRAAGRYVAAALPALPAADGAYDLALCSHLLFLYGEHLDESFHVAAIRELCRVAREVRIFPLVDLNGRLSPHLDAVLDLALELGMQPRFQQVAYEFQRGAHTMLRLVPL